MQPAGKIRRPRQLRRPAIAQRRRLNISGRVQLDVGPLDPIMRIIRMPGHGSIQQVQGMTGLGLL
jgi:hypothetical protein